MHNRLQDTEPCRNKRRYSSKRGTIMNENEQIFELITKLYDEMREIKSDVKVIQNTIENEVKTDIKDIRMTLENEVGRLKTRIEKIS